MQGLQPYFAFIELLFSHLTFFLTFSNGLSDLLLEGSLVTSPHYSSVQVGRTFIVWITQHRNDRHEDLLDSKNWSPSFIGAFLRIERIFTRRMENGNAHLSVLVNIRMPHFGSKRHGRRHVRKVRGKDQLCLEKASFVESSVRTHYKNFPFVYIRIIYKTNRNQINGILCQVWRGEENNSD